MCQRRRQTSLWLGVAALVAAGASASLARATAGPRVIEITASRYRFEPARVEVREGEEVQLVLRSADTTHGLAIKALNVKAAIPKGGAPVTIAFVASRPGRFPIDCSEYCGSGHKRMKAELVVTEASR